MTNVSRIGLAALVLAVVVFPIYKVRVIDGADRGHLDWAILYIGAEVVIAALCLWSLRDEGRPLADVGLRFTGTAVWWAVLGSVLAIAGAILVLRDADVLTINGRPGQDYGALVARTTAGRLAVVASSAIVVPIEELIWRGFAISRLERLGAPMWAAILLPSLAFGYFHGGTLDTLWITAFITIAAAGLSVLYVRTRSLEWPILIHFGWNALLISVTPTPV